MFAQDYCRPIEDERDSKSIECMCVCRTVKCGVNSELIIIIFQFTRKHGDPVYAMHTAIHQ